MNPAEFHHKGWSPLPKSAALAGWAAHALPHARAAVANPANNEWLRCGGTWFVGVNALPNDAEGCIAAGPGLPTGLLARVRGFDGPDWVALDRAQISVCYPGYPRESAGEDPSAFRFRRDRDAAHLDGLMRGGPEKRRFLRERHAFLLGIPLATREPGASPFVIWEGSHQIMREFLERALAGRAEATWGDVDVTDPYQDARREVFRTCPRVEITADPGEAYAVHRLALHGVAPWKAGTNAGPDGRMIAYFRPETTSPGAEWLRTP